MEIHKYLSNHSPSCSKCILSEENPGETNEMEREHDSQNLLDSTRHIITIMMHNMLTKELMNS